MKPFIIFEYKISLNDDNFYFCVGCSKLLTPLLVIFDSRLILVCQYRVMILSLALSSDRLVPRRGLVEAEVNQDHF